MTGFVDSSDLSFDLALLCLRALVSGIGMRQDAYKTGIGGTSTNVWYESCAEIHRLLSKAKLWAQRGGTVERTSETPTEVAVCT